MIGERRLFTWEDGTGTKSKVMLCILDAGSQVIGKYPLFLFISFKSLAVMNNVENKC